MTGRLAEANLPRWLRRSLQLEAGANDGLALITGSTTQQIAEKSNIERGVTTTNSTKGYYPSLNAALRLTENLQLRFELSGQPHVIRIQKGDEFATRECNTGIPRRPRPRPLAQT